MANTSAAGHGPAFFIKERKSGGCLPYGPAFTGEQGRGKASAPKVLPG